MKTSSILATLLLCLHAKHTFSSGDHDHKHSCACEAEEFGFAIDCDQDAPMLAALDQLRTLGCASDCSSEECIQNWVIVQSHHDYCPEIDLPTVRLSGIQSNGRLTLPQQIEDSFHDYDTICEPYNCEIGRKPVAGLPDCPAIADCSDGSGDQAYVDLISAGCLTNNCDVSVCRDNYFLLKAVHDNCPHESISQQTEEGIHDIEDICFAASVNCNSGTDQNLVCEESAGFAVESAMIFGMTGVLGIVLSLL